MGDRFVFSLFLCLVCFCVYLCVFCFSVSISMLIYVFPV